MGKQGRYNSFARPTRFFLDIVTVGNAEELKTRGHKII